MGFPSIFEICTKDMTWGECIYMAIVYVIMGGIYGFLKIASVFGLLWDPDKCSIDYCPDEGTFVNKLRKRMKPMR